MDNQAITFYTDEDVDGWAVEAARRSGVEIVTVREAGLLGESDPVQFAHAIENDYTLVTGNERDFHPLYDQWLTGGYDHPGVIFITNRQLKNSVLIADVLWLWHAAAARDDVRNMVEWI
jgi:predicted nuclease of predicted toxin-antitoxin system